MNASSSQPTAPLSGGQRPATGVHAAWFVSGLALMGVLLVLSYLTYRPPAPKSETAPANEFSAARALVIAERLLGDGAPHPVGTEANARVGETIVSELTELGYPVETQETLGCREEWAACGQVTNILARLPGDSNGPAVLLSAHYDSVPAGPGAADDIAGVAAILEIARILRAEGPFPNDVIFLLSDGEEPGLLGAEAFLAEHEWAREVGVVVNLEASGTSGPSILFESTPENAWMIEAYRTNAPNPFANSVYEALYELAPNNTDLTVYEAGGLPGINFAFIETLAQYHTPLDNLDNLNHGSVQHHGDNALASVRAFAAMDLANPPLGHSAFVDPLPGLVVQWPAGWTVWLAVAGLLLFAGVAAVLVRTGTVTGRGILWGLLVLPAALIVASVLGYAWALGVSALTGAPIPWYAEQMPMRIALWTVALVSLVVMAALVPRRAGFWGLSLGVWAWWWLLALVTAILAPGFSVMLLPPALLGTAAIAVVGLTPLRHRPWLPELAALVGLAGTSWFWLPFAIGVETSPGGAELGAMSAFMTTLAASAIVPFVAVPLEQVALRRWSLAGSALAIAIATGAALMVPVYSEAKPQQINLLHVEQRHEDQAMWLMDMELAAASAADAPAALLEAGSFGPDPAPALPWSGRDFLVAEAPLTTALAPVAEVLSDDLVNDERVVRVQLRSPRGGHELFLYVPETVGLRQVAVVDTPYRIEAPPVRNGYHEIRCHAPACDGLTLDLSLGSTEAVALLVADLTPGLPGGGETLVAARPHTAVPSHDGDRSLVVDQVMLPGI